MLNDNNYSIAVHGGVSLECSDYNKKHFDQYVESVKRIAQHGYEIIENGGLALDAVEAMVVLLEDDPLYNAGTGCCLTLEGTIELDSMLMDGKDQRLGAVAGVNFYKNPVKLARLVMDKSNHCFIMGNGLKKFAESKGIAILDDPRSLITDREINEFENFKKNTASHKCGDTVGAVALDMFGNMATATSTGGICGKIPGRVGDVPLVGCGGYADRFGTSSATGHGESIMRYTCCRDLVADIKAGVSPNEASKKIVDTIYSKTKGCVGVISLNRYGEFGVYHNGGFMPWAFINSKGTNLFKKEF